MQVSGKIHGLQDIFHLTILLWATEKQSACRYFAAGTLQVAELLWETVALGYDLTILTVLFLVLNVILTK